MTKDQLKAWIVERRLTRQQAADQLGLSVPALDHQISGYSPVSRQTEIIVGLLSEPETMRRLLA